MGTTQQQSTSIPSAVKIGGAILGVGILAFIIYKFIKTKTPLPDTSFGSTTGGGATTTAEELWKKYHPNEPYPGNKTTGGSNKGSSNDKLSGGSGAPDTVSPGEASPIIYISPRISGGKVVSTDAIEVRIAKGVFKPGDVVVLDQPNYSGTYLVYDHADFGDGGGSAFINTPYVDTGERNSAGLPQDSQAGTIAEVGQSSPSSSADGAYSIDAKEGSLPTGLQSYSAIGMDFKKMREIVKLMEQKALQNAHYLSPSEAATRKSRQKQGEGQGLKGDSLRSFIRQK